MTAKNPYRAGSLQEPGAYIEREADQRLRKELADNRRFPFIFAPPDSGKSSLLRRTLQGLEPGQHCGVLVDLSRLRLNDYTLFMGELLSAIAHEGDFDSREIAADCPEDTFLAWMGTFPQRLIVLLDGVEALARTGFSEQFFGKLKFLLNVRAENDEFVRLQLILASAIPMGRLVPTHLQTPYTTEITLPPLSPQQVDALAWHLNATQVEVDPHVGAAVYRHASGVPLLCQQLLAALWDEASANKTPLTVAFVNQLVDRGIDRAAQNEHLSELFRVITGSPTMLDTFVRLRRGQTVDPQRMQELVSTGVCDYDQPYRCSIYERVYGPGGPLDLTRAAAQRGAAEPQQEALSEPPRPPRPPEPAPSSPLPSGTQRAQLLPEPPRPTPSAPAAPPMPAVPPIPTAAAAAPPKPASAPVTTQGEFSSDEEQTAVDDLESRISLQDESPRAEGDKSPADVLRALLEEQLFLPAELDSFCISYFPPIARQFKATMSRAEKTNLLLAEAEPAAIVDRLKQWEASLERRQQVVSAVVATSAPVVAPPSETPRNETPRAESSAAPAGSPPPPPAAALAGPPPLPDPAPASPPAPAADPPAASPGFREPTAVLTVGVGLVLANRYFLTSEVGHGAVATVWNAYDRIKDEQVALKLLHGPAAENPLLVQRFWHSAQQQASLSHPAIVGVLNKPREESGIHYVVMEYVPAGNLRNWVINSKLTRTQLLRLMQRLGSALQYAHERKVLHRNVKPTNILFDTTGHARLVDFSLQWPADATAQAQSRSDRVIYMAPEEQLGDSDGDPRSDVYSLGMCALFALHGKELPSLVMQERAAFIEQLEVPPALKAVVKRAVAMNAADRFASAAEFCRALEVDAPVLPGISMRTSDIRPAERRASAEDIRPMKLESSQRMPVPALPGPPPPPPPPAPSPPPPPAAARPAPPPPPAVTAPPAPPPAVAAPIAPPPLAVAAPPAPPAAPIAPPPSPVLPPPRAANRISDEIPPVSGRSASSAAQYAIETEKIRAVSGSPPSSVSGSAGAVPLLVPAARKGGPWRAVAFATLGLVAISGGVLAYLYGTMPGHPLGDTALIASHDPGAGTRPVAEPLGDSQDPTKPLTAPVIPVQPVEKDAPAMVAGAKPDGKSDARAGGAAASGPKLAVAPTKEPGRSATGRPESAAAKGDPEGSAKTSAGTKVASAKVPSNAQPAAGLAQASPASEAAPPPHKTNVAVEAPLAAKTAPGPGPGVGQSTKVAAGQAAPVHTGSPVAAPPPPKQPGVPVIAGKQQPKTWEVVALTEPAPKPPVQHSVTIAGSPPGSADSDAGPRSAHSPGEHPSPASRDADAAAKHTAGDSEAIMHEAQTAFMHGDRQTAIAAAMRVTARGGEEAIKAWRFVGAAACSGRVAALAANAYRNLRDPDHKRLLVELCQRNGLHFHDGTFTPEE